MPALSALSWRCPLWFVLATLISTVERGMAAEAQTQLWSEVKVTSQWGDRFDLIAASALHFDDDVSHHSRTSCQFGLNLRATPRLTFTPSYQYIVHDPTDDVRDFEHRISLVSAFRLPFERCEATLSTGVEYRLRHDQSDGWRIRPRLKLKRAVGPDGWGLAAYVADELFYDTAEDDWTRNRLFAGFEKKLRRNWVLDLYYCRQHDLHTCNPDQNIIAISMRLSIDNSASDSRFDLQGQ